MLIKMTGSSDRMSAITIALVCHLDTPPIRRGFIQRKKLLRGENRKRCKIPLSLVQFAACFAVATSLNVHYSFFTCPSDKIDGLSDVEAKKLKSRAMADGWLRGMGRIRGTHFKQLKYGLEVEGILITFVCSGG